MRQRGQVTVRQNIFVNPRICRCIKLILPNCVQQKDPRVSQTSVCDLREDAVVLPSDVLEHTNADDTVKLAGGIPINLKSKFECWIGIPTARQIGLLL
jgi:hypothetical protein